MAGRTGGQTTTTDSRSKRIRVSRRGGQVLTRARGPSNDYGLPDLRLLPDGPVPDGRTVLTGPDATSVEAVRGHKAHLAAFHTGYQPPGTLAGRSQTPHQGHRPLPRRDQLPHPGLGRPRPLPHPRQKRRALPRARAPTPGPHEISRHRSNHRHRGGDSRLDSPHQEPKPRRIYSSKETPPAILRTTPWSPKSARPRRGSMR
jgi:hypothetical protein